MLKFLVARRFVLPAALIAVSAVSPFALGQQPPPQPAANQPSANQPSAPQEQQAKDQQPQGKKSDDSQEPTETLKVNVNVVQLFFNVKDKHGALMPNLTKDDFAIAEDGKPQTVKYFTAESNLPLTIGMMIDSSGSQRNVIDMEKEVGGAF